MLIRAEEQRDRTAVHAVNVSAFETPLEANLVDALREQARPLVSLIAEDNGAIVGHIMFSPVSLSGHPALRIMGLAPMAVSPERQRKGIAKRLLPNEKKLTYVAHCSLRRRVQSVLAATVWFRLRS